MASLPNQEPVRRWLVAVALLLATLPMPCAAAQADPQEVLSDPGDDVAVTMGGVAVPHRGPHLDLLGLDVRETPMAVTFGIQVQSLAAAVPASGLGADAWIITFEVAGNPHRLRAIRAFPDAGGPPVQGAVLDSNATSSDLPARFDLVNNRIEVEVPRFLLQQPSREMLERGMPLQALSVETRQSGQNLAPPDARPTIGDRMPDQGATEWVTAFGAESGESSRLASERPFRLSNGEATTYLFEVNFTTQRPGSYKFDLADVPSTWQVEAPIKQARVGSMLRFPVVVSVPFTHQHGTWEVLTLNAVGEGDTASVQLGVVYTDVPQPAGHHSKLFLHTDAGPEYARRGFMNTLEEDPADAGLPLPAEDLVCDSGRALFRYSIPLEPVLGMGMQTRDVPGMLALAFRNPIALLDATASGTLEVVQDLNRTELLNWSLPLGDLEAQTDVPISSPLASNGLASVPFQTEANLVAKVRLDVDGTALCAGSEWTQAGRDLLAWNGPQLLPGGWLDLPLVDYHDAVDVAFSSADLRMTPVQRGTIFVNPGSTIAVRAAITASESGTVDLSARAEGPAEASLVEPPKRAGQSQEDVVVRVTVSKDSLDGERIQVILVAHDPDHAVPAIAQFNLEVDTELQHESPEPLDVVKQESPAVGIGLVPLILIAALLVGRGRMGPGIRSLARKP